MDRPFSCSLGCPGGRALVLLAVLVALVSCTGYPSQRPLPTAAAVPSRQAQPSATPGQPTPSPLTALTLVWWTPEFLSPNAPQPAGPEIQRQLMQFSSAQQGKIRIQPVVKARYGKGGLLDYLLSAQRVAPSVLPDVIVLDVAELQQAAEAGLLQPLDEWLTVEARDALYPFATANGQFIGRLLAVQWLADLEHAAALPGQQEPAPQQWESLIASGTPYLFALGTSQAGAGQSAAVALSPAALGHYLSAGGTLTEDRELTLAAEPLRHLLAFYREADQAGLLPPSALELADAGAVWDVFVQGQVPLAQVSARRFYSERNEAGSPGFAAAPGWQAPATAIANGWALAIVATDPVRQEAAAKFVTWMLQAATAGSIAAAVSWLPTSPDALATWPASPHLDFLDEQLSLASPVPAAANYAAIAGRIQKAIVAVIEADAAIEATVEEALGSK